MLAETATIVLGVDTDPETAADARRRYGRANLSFVKGSCSAMPLPGASVDVFVSFESLEHHDLHEETHCEIRRVLVPGGLCITSPPDPVVHSARTGYRNALHIRDIV